ncbi:MAG: TM2 domain-containing protein [Lentisphaeria bacterium]|nr:TM2 domain-containing protein [Lentisphaeria bacterium]
MFCPRCGREAGGSSTVCLLCGASFAPRAFKPKSRVLYVFLAFFFGWLGIHNFYARRSPFGFAQLLLTVLSCGSFVAVCELWAIVEMFAVSRDGRNVPMRGRGVLAGCVLLGTALFLLFAAAAGAVAWPIARTIRENRQEKCCVERLESVGRALLQYAEEHNGVFPEELGRLGLASDETACPAAGPYLYLGSVRAAWTECPVLLERPGNHGKHRVNILYADGRVETNTYPESVRSTTELLGTLADLEPDAAIRTFLREHRPKR